MYVQICRSVDSTSSYVSVPYVGVQCLVDWAMPVYGVRPGGWWNAKLSHIMLNCPCPGWPRAMIRDRVTNCDALVRSKRRPTTTAISSCKIRAIGTGSERFAQLAHRLYRSALVVWVRLCGGREHMVGVLEPGVPLQRTLDPFRLDVKRLLGSELLVDLAQHTAALLARPLADFVQAACSPVTPPKLLGDAYSV